MCGRARFSVGRRRAEEVAGFSGRSQRTHQTKEHGTGRRGGEGDGVDGEPRLRFNGSPGHRAYILRRVQKGEQKEDLVEGLSSERELEVMVWGLVPSYTSKDNRPEFYKMFNARSESINERPAFRRLVGSRRCIVLIDGFYEWQDEGKGLKKQPYHVSQREKSVMKVAGLWDCWTDAEGRELKTFTILTRSSKGSCIAWLHDRCPVILSDGEEENLWLSPSATPQDIARFLSALDPPSDLEYYPVTTKINSAKYESSDCCERSVREALKGTSSIRSFFSANEKRSTKIENPAVVEEEDFNSSRDGDVKLSVSGNAQSKKRKTSGVLDRPSSSPRKRKSLGGDIRLFFSGS